MIGWAIYFRLGYTGPPSNSSERPIPESKTLANLLLSSHSPPLQTIMSLLDATPLSRKSLVRLIIAWVALYTLLITYGKARFFRDPGSIFYDPKRAYTRKYTNFRLKEVSDFIVQQTSDSNRGTEDALKGGNDSRICVHFATVKRDGEQYIEVAHTTSSMELNRL
jgi:hypothetical protein